MKLTRSRVRDSAGLVSPDKAAPKSESLHYNVNWPSGLSLG